MSYSEGTRKIQDHQVELNKIFSGIRSAGGYCVGGIAKFPCLPALSVDGVGEISFPISTMQAKIIKEVGSQAPYGKGAETVVDIKVRDSVQVEPSMVAISNPHWLRALQDLVREASMGMGIDEENIRAEFYKLLLYEKGGHFKAHTDSEKFPGMFGTLVVQFPSAFSGGTYTVRHQGQERVFSLGTDDATCSSSHHYVAHYADCEHEVAEITGGHRLVAVYSLIWTKAGLPRPVADASIVHQLAQYLKENLGNRTLGALLTHRYTKQSLGDLGILALKHQDRAIAGTLLAASDLLKSSRPGDELVLHIAKAHRLATYYEEPCYGSNEALPKLGLYMEEVDEFMVEVFMADGKPRSHQTAGISRFKFFKDIVNLDTEEEGRWNPAGESLRDRAGWCYEGVTGHTGNEGTADVYTRYVLTFCRRDVADGWQRSGN